MDITPRHTLLHGRENERCKRPKKMSSVLDAIYQQTNELRVRNKKKKGLTKIVSPFQCPG